MVSEVGAATSEEILENFSDVFEGLGCLSTEYKIQLEKDAKPVVHPPRKILFAMKNKLKRLTFPTRTTEGH